MSRRRRIDVGDLGPGAVQRLQDDPIGLLVSEETEQRALIAWADACTHEALIDTSGPHPVFRAIGDYLLAVPNGGARHAAEGGKLKAQGVRPGVPDLFFALPLGDEPGLWIELKRERGGGPTPAQQVWLERLAVAGYSVCCCHGWRDAARQILAYLENAR